MIARKHGSQVNVLLGKSKKNELPCNMYFENISYNNRKEIVECFQFILC